MSSNAQVLGNQVSTPQFVILQKQIANPHQFQFYMNYGSTEYGPWARIGFNDMEYVVGFYAQKETNHRPSQDEKVSTTTSAPLHAVSET